MVKWIHFQPSRGRRSSDLQVFPPETAGYHWQTTQCWIQLQVWGTSICLACHRKYNSRVSFSLQISISKEVRLKRCLCEQCNNRKLNTERDFFKSKIRACGGGRYGQADMIQRGQHDVRYFLKKWTFNDPLGDSVRPTAEDEEGHGSD